MAASVSKFYCKTLIFRNNRQRWKITNTSRPAHALRRQLRSLSNLLFILPIAHLSHLPHHPFQVCTHCFLSHPPLFPLLRPRSPPLSPPMSSASSSPDSAQVKSVRVVIKGVVQGVFFRDWTVENATDLGLNGWVRNRKDGSVEALFSGSSGKVDEMEQRCRRGPNGAMVTRLDSFPCTEDPGSGFQRRPTV